MSVYEVLKIKMKLSDKDVSIVPHRRLDSGSCCFIAQICFGIVLLRHLFDDLHHNLQAHHLLWSWFGSSPKR